MYHRRDGHFSFFENKRANSFACALGAMAWIQLSLIFHFVHPEVRDWIRVSVIGERVCLCFYFLFPIVEVCVWRF